MKRWQEGAALGKALCEDSPEDDELFLHTAFCLHELRRTQEAKQILLDGPKTLPEKALFHYNLGCYEAQLGNYGAAVFAVRKAVSMDPSLKKLIAEDPDLNPVRDGLQKLEEFF
jgi:tetratricopeptide (TPR) repeat protein